ncbi:nudix hydrolase 3-like isoform X4 [Mercurialis annua]|uniref:nudix hydrolase 3-like isoform X4 n=1 Tax=Mercurialis annua TaxID=3986 RepID=UPI0024AD4978|nr:nudix hydrolase 3-like isoform X4 [Mercurialis annua]
MAETKTMMIEEEWLDVLTKTGEKTGISKPRAEVHRNGDYHRAVHVWIYAESTQEVLLQKRADGKDSWAGLWDISSAGHISAADSSLITARRELQEELGIALPKDAFELLFVFLQECIINDGSYINNEYNDVYLVTTVHPIPLEAFTLQETEVSAVKYVSFEEYRSLLTKEHPDYVPYDVNGQYGQLFDIIQQSCRVYLTETRRHYVFLLRLQKLWMKSSMCRSSLDENKAFLTTADSAVKLLPEATKPVGGWKGLEYKSAFPIHIPPGANFYPPDMDKMEFELWKSTLTESQQEDATGFFTVIKRHSEFNLDSSLLNQTVGSAGHLVGKHDLFSIPYSGEYNSLLAKAAELLHKAGNLASSPSLKRLLHSKANAFLSNDYYDSDIAWMELDSKLDVTIGPYETYEDTLFGYKAAFEAFIGVRDDKATAQLKLFGDNLQVLEQNLPIDNAYKSTGVNAAPIRVIQLIFNAGDVKGPQTVAFNLPNDERIVKDRGTSMVMLKNVSQAKFKHILQPIADVCITKEQKELVDFESFFTHTICHECCHGIGPHSITLPNGEKSTVRKELQELHSALEEAKADIVGLWALKFLIDKDMLSKSLVESMYVSFLAGCFRSVRFGLKEAHGKGQAVQFNWLFEKKAFILHPDGTFSIDFAKVEGAVESLSREILTIQAKGDKAAARLLLQKYCVMTEPLKLALNKLEAVQVPVDIVPTFPIADEISE